MDRQHAGQPRAGENTHAQRAGPLAKASYRAQQHDPTTLSTSKSTLTGRASGVRYDNSYRLEPVSGRRFPTSRVESLLRTVLDGYLHSVKYDAQQCSRLSQDVCAVVKTKVKELNLPRYKIISHVIVAQDSQQSVQMASRCLWNDVTDNFASATFRNKSLFAIAVVYGVYLD